MNNIINKETLIPLMGEKWYNILEEYLQSEKLFNIYQILQKDSLAGIEIFPYYDCVFKFLKETDPDNIKLIIIGNEPYSGEYYDTKLPHASGISFDNSNCTKNKLQPPLEYFWEGLVEDLWPNQEDLYKQYLNKDLLFLCKQGVLLGNRSLTVQKGKISSYKSLWDSFWEFFFTEIAPVKFNGVPVILIGKDTHKLKSYIFNITNPLFMIEHPSYAAKQGQLWKTKKAFTKVSKILKDNNNYEIKWKHF